MMRTEILSKSFSDRDLAANGTQFTFLLLPNLSTSSQDIDKIVRDILDDFNPLSSS